MEQNQSQPLPARNESSDNLKLLGAMVFIVFMLWVAYLLICRALVSAENQGVFGDMFGGLNTLFAGIGAAFLLFTIYTQGRNLRDQQRDIERQLTIAERQGEALVNQGRELARAARANEHQVHVGIAQMKIAALQAAIEAAKIEALSPEFQAHQVGAVRKRIQVLADKITTISEELSNRTGGAHDSDSTPT